MAIDLRNCKPGDKLLSIHGTILEYVGPNPYGKYFPHLVKYPDGSSGTRTHDGHVFNKKHLPEDEDIVEILPPDSSGETEDSSSETLSLKQRIVALESKMDHLQRFGHIE